MTRQEILGAAEAVFSESGFVGARMEAIAERAGVAVGTLYNYFDDRRALLAAVISTVAEDLAARLAAEVPPARAPFADRLSAFAEISLAELDSHFQLYAVLIEEELECGRGLGVKRRSPSIQRLYAAAAALVADGLAAGELREEDAGIYALLLVGMLRGLLMRKLRAEGTAAEEPLAAAAPAIARLFLEGARRRAP